MPPNLIQEGLHASERDLRLIVDTIPGLVTIMTPGGELELVNQPVLDYFGRTLEELKSWGTGDTVHPDDLPAVIAAWTHSVETGALYEFEHRIRRADGAQRWFRRAAVHCVTTRGASSAGTSCSRTSTSAGTRRRSCAAAKPSCSKLSA